MIRVLKPYEIEENIKSCLYFEKGKDVKGLTWNSILWLTVHGIWRTKIWGKKKTKNKKTSNFIRLFAVFTKERKKEINEKTSLELETFMELEIAWKMYFIWRRSFYYFEETAWRFCIWAFSSTNWPLFFSVFPDQDMYGGPFKEWVEYIIISKNK